MPAWSLECEDTEEQFHGFSFHLFAGEEPGGEAVECRARGYVVCVVGMLHVQADFAKYKQVTSRRFAKGVRVDLVPDLYRELEESALVLYFSR